MENLPQKIYHELATITKDRLLTTYSITKSLDKFGHLASIKEVLNSEKTPALCVIRKDIGETSTVAYMKIWLIRIRESFNIGNRMTDEQCDRCAAQLVKDYYNFTVADISFIVAKATNGDSGLAYNRLDGAVIWQWFKQYAEERAQVAADMQQQKHDQIKYSNERQYSEEQRGVKENETAYQYFKAAYNAKNIKE